MTTNLDNFTDVFGDPDEICDSQPNHYSQPLSLSSTEEPAHSNIIERTAETNMEWQPASKRPHKGTGQYGEFRSVDEIDKKYRNVFSYPFFNLVQSKVIDDALYSDKSMVVCAPTGSGKTVVFEMAIVHLLMEMEDRNENQDFKIIYMAPVKALCTERLTEWYSKFTRLGILCIEVTGDTDVDFSQLKPYRIIVTTPEKWDMLTRRWRDHRQLVEMIKLFLIDEVHILNDNTRGPVLEAVVSRMKTIETSVQSTHRIEQLQQQYQGTAATSNVSPSIRFVAISATVSNPEDVATWLGTTDKPAVHYKFGDECRPVKLRRVVEGYPCSEGTSIFKFDLVLNYKLWPIIQKYHNGKPTLIFCNTRKSVAMTAETLSREITISFNEEQQARLTALASTIKTKKLQTLVLSGVGCHHAGLLYEERTNIEKAFRNRDLPILITTTTLAMGVNLPAHLVIIKNTQQYVNGAYQEYSISTVLQMVGRAGRPQFDTEATAVIMTRLIDKPRYQALVGGCEPLQSYLHKRLPENLNSEAALGTVSDVAQCVQWLRSTFLSVRAAKDPKRYLGLPQTAPHYQISKKIEELCVKAMNGLASSGLITMDEACCIESTEAGRLMSIFYLDLETMKHIMKIDGSESLERLLWIVCESHELSDMHLRIDERRCLNALNRNNAASTIRFPMKGKITTRQMKLNCVIQAILGCLPIPDPSLNQEATKIMRIADRVCKCLVTYVTRPALISQQPKYYSAILNAIILAKCIATNLWENSVFVSKQLKGIGPTFSTLLATAGKINFMLLEESHPRDLERIMNKGPPAGNVLRKQISLLPKYQLTMTPIDEKVVSIQLVLLNLHNLSENLDNLTAGASHKSYVVIGDSENILLLLTSFSDKDLIGVYNGSITYQITRKHGFEHKIYAHCLSSTFAGIDAQSEYIFKEDIEPQEYSQQSDHNDDIARKPAKKQTTITDTFKERKRRNTDNDITQSKEKKKRESALFEKFKNLKESFGKTSKVLKSDLDKSAVMSEKILQELNCLEMSDISSAFNDASVTPAPNSVANDQTLVESTFFEEPIQHNVNKDFINDEFMDEDKINDILNEIECEISNVNSKCVIDSSSKVSMIKYRDGICKEVSPKSVNVKYIPKRNSYPQIENYKATSNIRKRTSKIVPKKSNYNFIDLLEKNVDLRDAEENTVQDQNSFSDAIRSHIEKYLEKAKTSVKPPNTIIDLIQDEPLPSKDIEPVVVVQDSNITDKDDDIGREKQAELGGDEKVTFNVKAKQVTVLQHKIKSTDLTENSLPKEYRHSSREINIENELPVVELVGNIHRDDGVEIEIVAEKTGGKMIPGYNDGESNINYITKMENYNPVQQNTTENTKFVELNEEPDLNKKKSVSDVVDFPMEYNNKDKTSYFLSGKTPLCIPEITEKQIVEIEPLALNPVNQLDNEPRVIENRELIAYRHPTPIAMKIQTDFLQYNRNVKEIPITNSNVAPPMSDNFEKNKICLEQNDISKNLEVAIENEAKTGTELRKMQEVTATVLLKNEGFIPAYKPTNNVAKPTNVQNSNHNKLSIAFQTEIPWPKSIMSDTVSSVPEQKPLELSTTQPKIIYNNNKEMTRYNNGAGVGIGNVCYSAIGENLCSAQKDNNSSYSRINTQNHYINKYSFSSSKTDVSTQETADHVVRVIRKMRIDLDVTEIVPQDKKTTWNYTGVDVEEQIDNNDEDLNVAIKRSKLATTQNVNLCTEYSNVKVPSYRSNFSNGTKGEYSSEVLPKFDTPIVEEKISQNQTFLLLPDTEPAIQLLSNDTKHVEMIKENINCEVDKCNERKLNTFREYKMEDSALEKKPNNVLNILLKYSNIMRNNTRNASDHSLTQSKSNEIYLNTAKKDKPKRPFKISDIHRLNPTPLPNVFLIEKPKPVNVTECFNLLEPNYKQAMLDQNKQLKICEMASSAPEEPEVDQEFSMNRHEVVQNCFEKLEDIPYRDALSYEDLEVKNTISNIDQTMFNPKALLQCFNNDDPEDIVPPPPEFSDYLNNLDTNSDETLSMDCYEPMGCEEKNIDSSCASMHKSIFHDSDHVELTPSKEIETWNLPQDEGVECKMYASPASSPYTFTIMRKNKETTQTSSVQNSTLPRHSELKQFKFIHKNKFKL